MHIERCKRMRVMIGMVMEMMVVLVANVGVVMMFDDDDDDECADDAAGVDAGCTYVDAHGDDIVMLSLIHISEPTRLALI
eukprot:13606745-Alexandrium_andersonii.AAC.1